MRRTGIWIDRDWGGNGCHRPLTDEVEIAANKSGMMIAQFIEKPKCHRK